MSLMGHRSIPTHQVRSAYAVCKCPLDLPHQILVTDSDGGEDEVVSVGDLHVDRLGVGEVLLQVDAD